MRESHAFGVNFTHGGLDQGTVESDHLTQALDGIGRIHSF